jgi:hypothetical protein
MKVSTALVLVVSANNLTGQQWPEALNPNDTTQNGKLPKSEYKME